MTKKIQAQAEHQKICAVPPSILKALLSPISSRAARVGIGSLFYRWLIFFFSPENYSLSLIIIIIIISISTSIFKYYFFIKKTNSARGKTGHPSLVVGLYKLEMWNLVNPPSAGRKKFVYGGVVWIK